jgi:hypothetical protein
MIEMPEFQLVAIIVTLSQLIIIFALLKLIFQLFRKYGFSKKTRENVGEKETGIVTDRKEDQLSIYMSKLEQSWKKLEQSWKKYIDLQFEKLRKDMIILINEKFKNHLPIQGQTPGKGTDETLVISTHPPEEIETEPDSPVDNALQTCLRIYNAAISNQEEQGRFMSQYRPARVNVVNAMERHENLDLEPEFKSAYNGDFFVVELQNSYSASFVVFPRFGLTISKSNYSAGAVGDVFECRDYDRRRLSGISQVVSPASFAREGHDHWTLTARGKLVLDLADDADE